MASLITTAIVISLTLGAIGYLAETTRGRAATLQLLPGDIKYESPDGRVRLYFPVMTSIVLSVVLSLLAWLLG